MDGIERIATDGAPAPAGHYAQATAWRESIFASGQLPIRPDGTPATDEDFETQARRALANLLAVLSAAGSSPRNVLKVTAYVVGVENWAAFDRIYAATFDDARPARTVVPVPALHHGCLVEVDAIATRAAA